MAERSGDLATARGRALHLIALLEQQERELADSPPMLTRDEMARGQYALRQALEAARRTLVAIDQALALEPAETNEKDICNDH